MTREIIYEIAAEEKSQKISDFLKEKGYSNQNRTQLKWNENSFCLNGSFVRMNHILNSGDCLKVTIMEREEAEEILPVDLPFPIVYEDQDLVVVNKPAGMPTQPSWYYPDSSLGNSASFYYQRKGEPFIYRCVNRLDKDTTGLTIIAKHMVSSAILNQEMKNRRINRTYYAIVRWEDLPQEGIIDFPIGKNPYTANEYMIDPRYGRNAVTHFKVLKRWENKSYVELTLDTGRTHQIRVHMKTIGHPLLGDSLYYPEDDSMNRQALHAGKLELIHPITGEKLAFQVPLPEDMSSLLKGGQDELVTEF